MSATNTTTYYEFPVFVGSDKPAWLVDWNGAMNAIDSAIHEAKTEADANATNIASLQSSVTSLAGSVESQGTSITSLTQSLTSLQGTVNTITSLIGNGLPTTDDKTIIGAINELKAEIDALDPSGQGVQAENVSYDNTDSGLTATDVQSAIDELAQGGTTEADDVTYDNAQSGLTATDVQSAIDELATKNDTIVYSTTEHKIGTFVDGKDVYEKTYHADNVNISSTTVIDSAFTSTYIDTLIEVTGAVHGTFYNSQRWETLPFKDTDNGVGVDMHPDLRIWTEGTNSIDEYTITLRYTKA